MIQFPHNKLMINCPICETVMRNPRHLEQTSLEDGKVTKWHNTQNKNNRWRSNMTKAKETKKQRTQPWSAEEKKNLEFAASQTELELLKKQQNVNLLEAGAVDIDEEIEGYLGAARLEFKKAKLELQKMEFDKINNITKKETIFKLEETRKEVTRLKGNLEFQNEQIKTGKPILQEKTGPENNGTHKTQEEANEIAREGEAKAAQGE